jgi:iron complex outermembrane recepter protein
MTKRPSASKHPRQRSRFSRSGIASTYCLATAIGISVVTNTALAADPLDRPVSVDIQPQPLSKALLQLGHQARLQIMLASNVASTQRTQGIRGTYTANQALGQLLKGSGLSYEAHDDTVTVSPQKVVSAAQAEARSVRSSQAISDSATMVDGTKKNELADNSNEVVQRRGLEEIVVTAQKREERLQDVPVPVTAITADALVDQNQLRLQDYYTSVPGFSVTSIGAQSTQVLSIRGINTGIAGNPSVGIVIDDVPYGASTNLGGGPLVPDIDPFDLARVEILRGPQGTLYGASSLGGLVKFVTVDPSTDALKARVEAGTNTVHNGAQLGYGMRGAVNVPLSDTWAIRLSGFTRTDPGYIDNPARGIDGINKTEAYGGRISTLWRPSDSFSLKLSALFQRLASEGSSDIDIEPGLNDLQQNYLPGIGGFNRKFQAYSATIKAKLGPVDLTSITGYNINSYQDSWDYSFGLGAAAQSLFGVGGVGDIDRNRTNKVTEEVRASAPVGTALDWVAGLFYTHESSHYTENFLAFDPSTGLPAGLGLFTTFPTTFEEYAGFTDLTWHITELLDLQMGARESHINQSFTQTQYGAFLGGPTPLVIPETLSNANAFTYLVTPRFTIRPDLMVYVRAASGYRAGGANALLGGPQPGIPPQYSPDKTQDYELGLKGDFFSRKLSLDTSLYYIDWASIQLSLLDPTSQQSYLANAGKGKSQGIELSATVRPIAGLSLSAWASYDDAVLTRGFPAPSTAIGGAYGVPGNRLPYTSRLSGTLTLDDELPIVNQLTGFVGGAVSYVGGRLGEFTGSPVRQIYPAYTQVNLHIGVRSDTWAANLYVNNLIDRRGVLAGGLGSYPPFGFTYIQPRMVGISIARTFERLGTR